MTALTTDAERLRLLISDVGGDSGSDFIFTDDEVDTFLALEGGVYEASALALRTLAANEVLVQKRIKFLELSTDGPAEADALSKLADALEQRADAADEDDTLPGFANFGDSPTTRRNIRLGLEGLD